MQVDVPTAHVVTAELNSEAETADLALRLSAVVASGDILLLSGDLGAGKTAFARAFIQARQQAAGGRVEDVPSPTFTLVQTYAARGLEIWHADLYRLGDPSELAELGLLEAGPDAVLLVEWPEQAGDAWPGTALWLRFDVLGPDARQLSLGRVDGKPLPTRLSAVFATT